MTWLFFDLFQSEVARMVWQSALASAPIWIPLFLLFLAVDLWVKYQQRRFIREKGSILLEIKLPTEVTKSPAAMEAFFQVINEPVSGPNALQNFLKGSVRPHFSLEIASLEGS